MRLVYFMALITFMLSSTLAMASPQVRILTCGDVEIWSEFHASAACKKHNVGPLKGNSDWELGRVYSVIRNSNNVMPFPKVGEANRSMFGKKKGFGIYQNENFILDLRNTTEINPNLIDFYSQIKLWDKNYRGYITCSISGYHNLSCGSY